MSNKKTKLSEILQQRKGRYKPDDPKIKSLKRIDKIDFKGNIYFSDKPSRTNMILVKKGDLVISGINVAKGAMAVYDGDEDVKATIHYSSYTFDSNLINIEYLKRFLKSEEFINELKENVKGGIKTEIKPKHLLPIEISLPGIDKQKEIVNKFVRIEGEYKELNKQITYQQTYIQKLRQQILQEAIQGKLTEEWRRQNPDTEPASELLKRIKAEKEKLVKEGKIKKQQPLPPIKEEEKPFELPEGWVWCRLGEVVYLISGQHIQTTDYNKEKEGIPYLTGPIDFGESNPIFSKWTNKPKVTAQKSDILITVKGSGVGKLNILHKNHVAISRQLMAIRKIIIDYYYIWLFLHSEYEIFQEIKDGLIPGISRADLLNKLFPLPPNTEQKVVNNKVKSLLANCLQLQEQTKKNEQYADRLMQAVLREAFE
jgi:type I restriction enzyme S subunit